MTHSKVFHNALLLAVLAVCTNASAGDFVDDFSTEKLEGRLAERGAWTFENNTARCVADPELYKKFSNHGPILKWPGEFQDGTVEFEMKVTNCQRVVFTLNGDGHVFRVTLADETPDATAGKSKVPTRLIAWAEKSSKQNKGDTLKPDGLPDLPAVNNKWVKVRLAVSGNQGSLSIGNFSTQIEHAALARPKNTVMVTFAHGELAVRDYRFIDGSGTAGAKTTESVQQMKTKVGDHQLTYLVQSPAGDPPTGGWPMMLFLHGYGECGTDIDVVRKHGPPKLISKFDELSGCVIVSPQCPKDSWWRVAALKALVEEVVDTHPNINRNRLYITGLSMGGYGTWSFISHHPDFFAAAVPICGGGDPFRLPKNVPPVKTGIKNEFLPDGLRQAHQLPMWTFHGAKDGAVPVGESERLVELLRTAGSDIKFTVYEDADHVGSWQNAYADPELWKWMFSQRRPAD